MSWTIDQLVTWVALNSYREYEVTYNHFNSGYQTNLGSLKRMAKIATAMALLVYDKAIEDIAGRAIAAATNKKEALGQVVLRTYNYPSHYVTTEAPVAKIAELKNYQDKKAALLRMTFGLAEGTCVSFESVNRPGFYLSTQISP